MELLVVVGINTERALDRGRGLLVCLAEIGMKTGQPLAVDAKACVLHALNNRLNGALKFNDMNEVQATSELGELLVGSDGGAFITKFTDEA